MPGSHSGFFSKRTCRSVGACQTKISVPTKYVSTNRYFVDIVVDILFVEQTDVGLLPTSRRLALRSQGPLKGAVGLEGSILHPKASCKPKEQGEQKGKISEHLAEGRMCNRQEAAMKPEQHQPEPQPLPGDV